MALVFTALVPLVGLWEPTPFPARDGVCVASPSPVADVTDDGATEKIMDK